jgi:hypothetical protein
MAGEASGEQASCHPERAERVVVILSERSESKDLHPSPANTAGSNSNINCSIADYSETARKMRGY